ncbi:MAG: cobalamin biosynthesis protein CobW [Alphaproteobacteria bacterium]|nr:cobalamin biosynthesis protein CobW [Alphaproteobacteria bacterium]
MRRIPATIVTGFLGAGKTSLIRSLVENAGSRRLAFLINEFGELGVDRELLTGCGLDSCTEDDVVELTNGCLCCTVADDFLPAITKLLDRADPPEHIIIETSGLALPKPLVKAFGWPEVRSRVTVDGVVAVVDAPAVADGRFADDPAALAVARAADPSLDHESPLAELFADQLACADLVVLNKADLLDAAAMAALAGEVVGCLRPGVKTVTARHGRLAVEVLLGLGAAAEDDLVARPSVHDGEGGHEHDDFDSFLLALPDIVDPDGFARRIAAIAALYDVLRMKGFLAVPGRARRLVVQGVGDRVDYYFDRDWREDERRASRLVVVGRAGLDRAAIAAALGGSEA